MGRILDKFGYVWICFMPTSSAPTFSAMIIPSPVIPGPLVERIVSSILGLYLSLISRLEPKPPEAITTPFVALKV